jgi:hypothetical protein
MSTRGYRTTKDATGMTSATNIRPNDPGQTTDVAGAHTEQTARAA